ncbi:MAG: hypothetical protein EPN72_01985 [Nevskiaceae bacterium]|nr:MAG: hypothetical protein EPN63_12735 [Nevskiaceae bacterium]TBR74804.1 MAG: hypothetical protein EPN72_01985 [Nevskiaceae bacterium]
MAGLGGCATTSSCKTIAGPGWQLSGQAPANAGELLGLEGVTDTRDLIWLHKGDDKVMGCQYKSGLIYPGCSGSVGYVFEKQAKGWKSDGVVMDACDANGVQDTDD